MVIRHARYEDSARASSTLAGARSRDGLQAFRTSSGRLTPIAIAYFFSLLFVALALGPSAAHLLELLNKIDLPVEDYFTVQQIYRGWALLGIVVFGALISTLVLTVLTYGSGSAFILNLIAFLCIVGTQVIFWTFTYPANQETSNWTVIPDNWMALRTQWEYSHAAGALLNLSAMVALILSLLVTKGREEAI
jgi:hypothetical protein